MTLSKPWKIAVGLGTMWFALFPCLAFATWLIPPENEALVELFVLTCLLPYMCLTVLLQFALTAFYLIHIIKNLEASETVRIILGIGLFFMPYIAMPVYYYIYIWRDPPPEWAMKQRPAGNKESGALE